MTTIYPFCVDYRNEVFAEELEEKYAFKHSFRRRRWWMNWMHRVETDTSLRLLARPYRQGGFINVWFMLSRTFWNRSA